MAFYIVDDSAIKGFRKVLTYDLKSHNPVLRNDTRNIETNSMIIQNCGNVPCLINGNWTLNPGSTLQWGSTNNRDLYKGRMHFKFKFNQVWETTDAATGDPVTDANARVEILTSDFHDTQLKYRQDHV